MSGPSFAFERAKNVDHAVSLGADPATAYVAGGTDLMQLWKDHVRSPQMVIDLSGLPLQSIKLSQNSLEIGALAKLSALTGHPGLAETHPLICEAIGKTASAQIRNMASVGGNLLQRTRCSYFRNDRLPCNKRLPDSGCGALTGENRGHAVFGSSGACVATHPSDLAVALCALDAEIEIVAKTGRRRIAIADLYREPGKAPQTDTTLAHGDLITKVCVSDGTRFAKHSAYLKVRDRASFEFAVVSVAAAFRLEGETVIEARLYAGGVAPHPWRLKSSEDLLIGYSLSQGIVAAAALKATEGAKPLSQNGFKLPLLQRAVARAIETAAGSA